MQGSYLGPEFSQSDIEERLARAGAQFTRLSDDQDIDRTVEALADGKAIGWFQGRTPGTESVRGYATRTLRRCS